MKDLAACVVLVTPRSFGRSDPDMRAELERAVGTVRYNTRGRPLHADELRAEIADVDGLIAGLDEIDATVFAAAPHLRVVCRYGVGTSNVDLAAAATQRVVVTNTPSANADSVAELTVGFMFALARALPQAVRASYDGRWSSMEGTQIAGKTVSLLGFGRIGQAVAWRARALGCTVLANDPGVTEEFVTAQGVRMVSRDEAIGTADFLSLHLPVTPETRDLVNRELLSKLPSRAFLINTARGELVVEEDLVAALEAGCLRGAALDVLRQEPPPADHQLLRRADVLITPHVGAHTAEATTAMGRMAMHDLLAVLAGETARFPVNTP